MRLDPGCSNGTIYTALRKMKAKGLVIPIYEDGESRESRGGGGPARVWYQLPEDIWDHFPALRVLVEQNKD